MSNRKMNFEQENNMDITSRNYKKAMENVILSDEMGMKLLNQAEERASQKRRRLGQRLAAAILSIAILGALGTGACYASTGQSPISLFENLFTNNNEEAVQKTSDQFVESNETIYFEDLNLNITLEKYVFNREQGVMFCQLKVCAADGSYLVDWDDLYQYLKSSGNGENYRSADALQADCTKNPEKMYFYRDMCENLLEDRLAFSPSSSEFDYALGAYTCSVKNEYTAYLYKMLCAADTSDITSNTVSDADSDADSDIKLPIKDNGDIYSTQLSTPPSIIGEFTLKETGQLDIRTLDCSSIPYCKHAEISGGFIRLNFDAAQKDQWEKNKYPITTLIIKLKDGTQYIYDDAYDDEIITEQIQKNENLVLIDNMGFITTPHIKNAYSSFPDYLDLDDIDSILINGRECPMK